jgi:type VI secretion system protein ImpC
VKQHRGSFTAHADASVRAEPPHFVKDEFDAFIAWGIPARGFLSLRCGECGRDRRAAAAGGRPCGHAAQCPGKPLTGAPASKYAPLAVTSNAQKFIARNRAPRVQIAYDVELYGAERRLQLPFVIGVLADLSGHADESLRPLAERKFVEVDIDNFDTRMAVMRPRLVLQVPDAICGVGALAAELAFESLADFEPAAVARRLSPLQQLVDRRGLLAALLTYADGKVDAEDLLQRVLGDAALLRELASGDEDAADTSPAPLLADGAPLAAAVQQTFRPRTGEALQALLRSLRALAQEAQARGTSLHGEAITAIERLLAGLDALLSRQLRVVMHHPEFQRLEGTWRGLYHLVANTETGESLKIRVLDVSRKELGRTLRRYKGTNWDQSPLFKRIYEDEFGSFGGQPYGCLIGDYMFDHAVSDSELLGEMAKICAAAHAPFIAGAALSFAGAGQGGDDYAAGRTVVGQLITPEFAAWRSLQHADESRYIALALPRFLARLPWGGGWRAVDEFAFDEMESGGAESHVWCNAAWAMAVSIARAHALYGWCVRIRGIESGGAVEGLPSYRSVTATGEPCTIGPLELEINDRAEAELVRAGFLTLVHRRGTDYAAFTAAPTIHQHGRYEEPAMDAAARLGATLPYLLAGCRFVQVLKCIVRDQLGSFHGREALERLLQRWLDGYVEADAANSSDAALAQRPLAAAEVLVAEVEGNPGYYTARVFLTPAYQFEGPPVPIRLVTRLPSGRGTA